jgi:hypothetical protein
VHKKPQTAADERYVPNAFEQRLDYHVKIAPFSIEQLFFVDETGIELKAIFRRYVGYYICEEMLTTYLSILLSLGIFCLCFWLGRRLFSTTPRFTKALLCEQCLS